MVIYQSSNGLGCINIHANIDAAFRGECEAGHFEVVQWLYT